MKKTIYLLLALMIGITGFSQHTFKVLACKGQNAMKSDGKWNPVKAGTKLYDSNIIKLEKGGYMGLIHKDGKTLELKSEGEYSIADLTTKLASKNSNFTSKYASFVASNMNGSETGYNHNVTGSVSRGNPQLKYKVFAEDNFVLIKDKEATIAWDAPVENKEVVVRIMNFYAQVVYEEEFSGFEAKLNLTEANIKTGENYFLTIADKNKGDITSKQIPFTLLADDKSEAVQKELTDMETSLDQESVIDQLILASFYEEKGLSLYATESLRQSMVKMPECEDFKINYRNYLATKNVATPATFKW